MKDKTVTIILCEGKIVGQHAEHDIYPIQITYPAKAGLSDVYKKLLACTALDRMDDVKIHGATYVLYFDKNHRKHDELIATYPIRDKNGKIYSVIAGSVLIAKEDHRGHVLDISKDEWSFITKYLDKQTELAGMAILFGKG